MINKILYVGHGKTGTSTFGTACEVLGYKLYENDYDLMRAWNKKEYDKLWPVADLYDVFEDYPWPYTYKEFDKHYPDTKFVLGLREPNSWVKSVIYQSLRGKTVERRNAASTRYLEEYGFKYPVLHEEELKLMFLEHNNEVIEYFKDRPNDFLIVNWWEGSGWMEICKFLGKPIPNVPFPHRKNAYPYPDYKRMRRIAMREPEKYFGW